MVGASDPVRGPHPIRAIGKSVSHQQCITCTWITDEANLSIHLEIHPFQFEVKVTNAKRVKAVLQPRLGRRPHALNRDFEGPELVVRDGAVYEEGAERVS